MKHLYKIQFFADEAAGDAGVAAADAGQQTGEGTGPAAGDGGSVDRDAEFAKLIQGDYAEAYHKQVEGIVQKRLHNSKARLADQDRVLSKLSSRYGVDAGDTNALLQAIDADKAYLREQADENGVTEDVQAQLNELKALRERKAREDNFNQLREKLGASVEETQAVYPSFDLAEEMQDQRFMQFVSNGLSIKDAYEIIHKDEIIGGAMQYTADKVKEKVVNDIRARGLRPSENGAAAQSSARRTADIGSLGRDGIDKIIERAKRGEKITFRD